MAFKDTDFPELALMRAGVDYHFPITLRQLTVMVRPLSNLEIIEATAAAGEAYNKLPQAQQVGITASLLNAMHQLEKASSPEPGAPGKLSYQLIQRMNPDEINHLWKQYIAVTERVNPAFESVPAEELAELVETLKKSSERQSILTELSISRLVALSQRLLADSTG